MRDRNKKLLEFLEESGAYLHTLLMRLTLREDVSEDLMQELFIKLSCKRGLDSVANMRAYAQKAAINLAFDWRRKNRQDTVKIAGFDKPVSKEVSPLRKLIQDEELEEVLDVIGRLKGAGRQVIVMRYIQQQSYDLIAGQLGNTPHQARALCHKALSQIRALLQDSRYQVGRKRLDNV